jgi:hypothetical protein
VLAIQIPASTAARPIARLGPILSWSSARARSEAATGFTVSVAATRVGVVRAKAKTQR